MKKPSRKLSGQGLVRFFRRFYRAHSGLDRHQADALAAAAASTFASVHLRRSARIRLSAQRSEREASAHATAAPQRTVQSSPSATEQAAAAPPTPAPFDPYAFGLVPIFQREGRDGLLAKLIGVTSADDLRKMARAQQIALPADLRKGDIALDVLRDAIADAVQKRIADRRAAAG